MLPAFLLFTIFQFAFTSEKPFVRPKCCPPIKPVAELDFKKYAGFWLDFYHTVDMEYTCALYEYVSIPKGYTLYSKALDKNNKPFNTTSYATFQKSTDPGALCSRYMQFEQCNSEDCGKDKYPEDLNVFVLGTDYTTYTVEYNCYCDGDKKKETVWVMYRKGVPENKCKPWMKLLHDNKITSKLVFTRNCCAV